MDSRKTVHKVSSKDVARLAGVSQSTVSRAYNPAYPLKDSLKKKVFAAAKELGYRPNAIARSLLSNRTNIIGIVTSNLDSPFISNALNSFIFRLQESGFQSLVFVARHSDDIDTVVDRVLQYQVDLLLIFGARSTTRMTKMCTEHGTPVVLFNRYIPHSGVSAVCCNDLQCGQQVAEELYASGYRNFAYVSGFENATTSIDRKAGFMAKLQELGVENCQVIQGGYSYEAGLRAGEAIIRDHPDVDVCFCANDITALGVYDYVKYVAKRNIPEEFGVVGFDDIDTAQNLSYRLTTVRQPIEQMVEATIATIHDTLADPSRKPVLKIIEGEYIKRDTTRSMILDKE